MIKYENRCCGCAVPAYPCRGSSCPLRSVPVYYCDNCGKEIEGDVHEKDGEELCAACFVEQDDD